MNYTQPYNETSPSIKAFYKLRDVNISRLLRACPAADGSLVPFACELGHLTWAAIADSHFALPPGADDAAFWLLVDKLQKLELVLIRTGDLLENLDVAARLGQYLSLPSAPSPTPVSPETKPALALI